MKNKLRFLLEYVEIIFIPALSIILPWPIAFRFYQWVSRFPKMYSSDMEVIFEQAKKRGLVKQDKATWIAACKLGYIIDYADVFLCLTRGRRFVEKYVEFDAKGLITSGVIFTPHYGMGLWFFRARALSASGDQKIYLLANRGMKGYSAMAIICRLRAWVLAHLCGGNFIYPDQLIKVRQTLREKGLIMAMPDVIYDDKITSFLIDTKLGRFNVAAGFFDIAAKYNLPMVKMIMGQEGLKHQIKYDVFIESDAKLAAEQFAVMTVDAITEKSYLWRGMLVAPEIIK